MYVLAAKPLSAPPLGRHNHGDADQVTDLLLSFSAHVIRRQCGGSQLIPLGRDRTLLEVTLRPISRQPSRYLSKCTTC
jgi:hypothetical protein